MFTKDIGLAGDLIIFLKDLVQRLITWHGGICIISTPRTRKVDTLRKRNMKKIYLHSTLLKLGNNIVNGILRKKVVRNFYVIEIG